MSLRIPYTPLKAAIEQTDVAPVFVHVGATVAPFGVWIRWALAYPKFELTLEPCPSMVNEESIETVLVTLKLSADITSFLPELGVIDGKAQVAPYGAVPVSVPASSVEEAAMPLHDDIHRAESAPVKVKVCPDPTVGLSQ
jgi:hypothetical protein